MNRQVANLLGLCQRAGYLISGEDLVVQAIQKGQAQLIFLAQESGPNLRKKITDKSKYYKVEVLEVSELALGQALGKARKVAAITNQGFAKKMRSIMQ